MKKLLGIFTIMALIGLCFWACEEPKSESALKGKVIIIGTAQVEEELTVDTSALKGEGNIYYEWKRNGTEYIGSGDYYLIEETDIGSFITVTVTRTGYSGSVTSAPTAVVTDASFLILGGMVSISGTAMVDQIFTADTSGLGGSGTITYQWTRNGIDIIGTNSTYIVQNADIGSTITVTVTRADNSGSVTSQPTIPVTDPTLPALTGTVSINGTAQVGQTLTANTSALGGSGTIYYQWRQNGTTVVGANSPTYTVTTAGYTITVTVTCSENSSSITSAPTGAAADDPSLSPIMGNVNVNGITQVGQALTADISSLGGNGTIHYRWQRNGTDIGTNSNTYILIYSDVGSTITVSVSRQGYSGKVTSAPTAVIVSDLDANGLRYRLINHNTAYSVSKGTATDVNITIPAVYNGLPVTTIPENGFSNYTNLTSIVIPESMTEVGYNAFSGCANLSITWNYNPEAYINDYYFYGYVKIINISDSVTDISDYAFYDCSSLETINVNAINQNYSSQDGILYNKAKTEIIFIPYEIKGSITIPDGVTSIDGYAFYQCTGLTSVTIPSSVTSIGSSAFYGCTNLSITWNYNPEAYIGASYLKNYLKTVIISNSVTSIGEWAFSYCTGLTSITIPSSVTSIGEYAFSGCTGLTSINVNINNPEYSSQDGILYDKDKTELIYVPSGISGTIVIPNSVEYIGSNAFSGCTGLTSITIPNSVTYIGYYAFSGCTNLSITWNYNPELTREYNSYFIDYLKTVIIPNSVTSIGREAFYGFTGLTSITIPNSVTSIGSRAFRGCTGLTSITIGNSVTSIGYSNGYFDSAFSGCTSLTSINVDINNPNYASQDGILYNKVKTQVVFWPQGISGNVTIPNSVTSIGDYAFYDFTGLTSITIPDSVTSIGSSAFRDCTGLTSITIGNSVTRIDRGAFRNCTGLTSITIPSSVTSIGFSNPSNSSDGTSFEGCTNLTSINLDVNNPQYSSQDGIVYNKIKTEIISVPQGITGSIVIPDSVTSIGYGAFRNCTDLTSITIPNSVTSIGGAAFEGCTSLTSITIPNSVTSIYISTFGGCKSLISITIPDGVTDINNYAFSYCTGLTSITIPNSVTFIGNYVFVGCTGLTSVTIGANMNISSNSNLNSNFISTYNNNGKLAGTYTRPNISSEVWTRQ